MVMASFGGLSPRTRGSPRHPLRAGPISRSIPAHAGEPPRRPRAPGRPPVYPRARGGAQVTVSTSARSSGLSPRTRGSPTCSSWTGIPSRVYPRARGGARSFESLCRQRGGLSPRTRGSLRQHAGGGFGRRSIPAHAGEPRRRSRTPWSFMVYPRARGGAVRLLWRNDHHHGLSPRTRGSQHRRHAHVSHGLSPRTRGIAGLSPRTRGSLL